MKKNLLAALLLLAMGSAYSVSNSEFRGTWVITWEAYNGAQPVETIKTRIRKILDDHQKANMNAVLWQVRQGGTAYYESNYEPWGAYLDNKSPGFDPLAYAIEEAHSRGMELHAWFNTFQTSSTMPGTPAADHPEWVCRNASGQPMTASRALSPGLAAVRSYTVAVAMDLVRRYDIDGLHLDYVRWNEESGAALQKEPSRPKLDGQISPAEVEALNASLASRYLYDVEHPFDAGIPAGFPSWEEWWRWSTTEFVRTLHDSVQAAKPWVRLSAAALGNYNWGGWNGYGTVFQDAALWFNQGYVDQLTPMHYHWTTGAGFYDMLTGSATSWGPYIQPGIAAGRLFSVGPGSYILNESRIMDRHASIVDHCRLVPWVDGFQFFSYGTWEDNKFFSEAGATFFPNKTKIRAAKFLHDATPDQPQMNVSKIDSLTYEINITPPPGQSLPMRMALYRSEVIAQQPDQDPILQIFWSDSSVTFVDHFSGLQDHEGSYYYYVTAFDRYWNESLPSPAVETAPVPSFAPQVVATTPPAGDTVSVTANLELHFSKSMDQASVESALSCVPAVLVRQYKWSDGGKSLAFILDQALAFAASYTMTLAESAQDVNGKALDGDNDGLPGGAFHIHFVTETKDTTPPAVLSLFPSPDDGEPLPVEGLVNIVFSECIAPASIMDSTIVLTKDGAPIQSFWLHVPVGSRSVLSIQPVKAMEINSTYNLTVKPTVADTFGNVIPEPLSIEFTTRGERTLKEITIDKFFGIAAWKDPSYSGSTVGVLAAKTLFEMSRAVYLPNSYGTQRYSAALRYQWDPEATDFLCREYLDPAAAPGQVFFDTTYTLQLHVFGDGSGTLLRLALDETAAKTDKVPEVTQWVKVDWYGWRLVEWKLSDPAVVGSWLGNGILEGNKLSIDSIQLTKTAESAFSGAIYFDNLVAVKKTNFPTAVEEPDRTMPAQFALGQNYPNPFNPATRISFDLPRSGQVRLAIYDMLGREVAVLVDGARSAGRHEVEVNARGWSSGAYFYRLSLGGESLMRKMLVLK